MAICLAKRLAIAGAFLAFAAGAPAARAGWTVTPLKPSGPGFFFPVGIDNSGRVFGGFLAKGNPNFQAVLATPKNFQVIHPCGTDPALDVFPIAADGIGRVLGECGTSLYLAKGKAGAFQYGYPASDGFGATPVSVNGPLITGTTYQPNTVVGGEMQVGFIINTVTDVYSYFVAPGATATTLNGATNSGNTLFGTCVINGVQHGFAWRTSLTLIDLPGYTKLTPTGANLLGQIVGTVLDSANNQHAFVFQNGVVTLLHLPNEVDAVDVSINDKGQAVGVYLSQPDFTQHVFRWAPGTGAVSTFDLPAGNVGTGYLHINNKGEIVGTYRVGDNDPATFVAACTGTGC